MEERKDIKKLKKSANESAEEKEPLYFDLNDVEALERNCEIRNLNECVDILVGRKQKFFKEFLISSFYLP